VQGLARWQASLRRRRCQDLGRAHDRSRPSPSVACREPWASPTRDGRRRTADSENGETPLRMARPPRQPEKRALPLGSKNGGIDREAVGAMATALSGHESARERRANSPCHGHATLLSLCGDATPPPPGPNSEAGSGGERTAECASAPTRRRLRILANRAASWSFAGLVAKFLYSSRAMLACGVPPLLGWLAHLRNSKNPE